MAEEAEVAEAERLADEAEAARQSEEADAANAAEAEKTELDRLAAEAEAIRAVEVQRLAEEAQAAAEAEVARVAEETAEAAAAAEAATLQERARLAAAATAATAVAATAMTGEAETAPEVEETIQEDINELAAEVQETLQPVAATPPVAPAAAQESNEELPLVLAVDDSPTIRKLLTMTLERHGFRIISAADGVEALTLLSEQLPDVILSDINMPRLGGYQLCKFVKKYDRTKHIPVIMLSGKDGVFDKMRGKMNGCNDYIVKPFDASELIAKVKQHAGVTV